MTMLIYGLITGILFGFFLQKGRVLRYDKQVGALRLLDMTIVKFMLSSVLVGMICIYLLKDLGLVNTRKVLKRAMADGYAVPAYNFNNMQQLQVIPYAMLVSKWKRLSRNISNGEDSKYSILALSVKKW